jgi:rhodanese-related sulfurtransferase
MKKIITVILLFASVLIFISCNEGYTSSDGKSLKKYLPPEKLKELIESTDDSIWIIDVRPFSAYKNGHIPEAKSFPSSEIISRLNEIPKDKYLILYCETGGRAQTVIKMLEKEGYTRMMNWGGYKRWPYDFVKDE